MCVVRFACVMCSLMAAVSSFGQGGPPMMTDDPGTPPVGKFELNMAWTTSRNHESFEFELPLLDLSYGATPNLQLKIEGPWLTVREAGTSSHDLGPALVGVKWRFQEEANGRPAISTFPQIETAINRRSVDLGLADPGLGLLLPVEVQWHRGRLGFNMDFGVVLRTGGQTEWFGGGAVSTEIAEGQELIAELHFEGAFADRSHEAIAQIGYRRDLSESMTLLAAFGKGVQSSGTPPTRFASYLGLQFRF